MYYKLWVQMSEALCPYYYNNNNIAVYLLMCNYINFRFSKALRSLYNVAVKDPDYRKPYAQLKSWQGDDLLVIYYTYLISKETAADVTYSDSRLRNLTL